MDTTHRPHPRHCTPPDIYRDAIRHRLGCQFLPVATTCHCGGKLFDVQCVHAGCCATSEATRGHYAVVRAITAVAKTIDPTTSREETFGDTQRLRPGDVITNAVLDGRRMAIDVGVTSQAKRTQGDPIQDYEYKGINKYRQVIYNELLPEGTCFRAAIWTQEGRPGKDAIEVIEGLARQAEKYLPGAQKKDVRERLRHEITTQLQTRIVKMIRTCIPPPQGQQAWLCLGSDEDSDPYDSPTSDQS